MRGKGIQIAVKAAPLLKPHLNGVSLAGPGWPHIECWLGSFVIFQGIWTSIAKKPFIFVIFQGWGGPDPLSSPLWMSTCILICPSQSEHVVHVDSQASVVDAVCVSVAGPHHDLLRLCTVQLQTAETKSCVDQNLSKL